MKVDLTDIKAFGKQEVEKRVPWTSSHSTRSWVKFPIKKGRCGTPYQERRE